MPPLSSAGPATGFFAEAAAGKLPAFSLVEPSGYYDHVPPPPALAPDDIKPKGERRYQGFRQYGFRVPMAVVSPWARRHHISHEVMDHTSICALVSTSGTCRP